MTIDQEFVEYIVKSLVSHPDDVKVERTKDDRGILLTLHVNSEDLGRVIGRKGSTAQGIRTILRALGSKNQAHYNLRIADDNSSAPASKTTKAITDSLVGSDEEADQPDFNETTEEADQPAEESFLDQTKKELDKLNDLDI